MILRFLIKIENRTSKIEIFMDLDKDNNHELLYEPTEKSKHSPFFRLVAVITIISLFFLSVQAYFYLMHPEPKVKLVLIDIQEFLPSDLGKPFASHSAEDIGRMVLESRNVIKQVANKIAADSCSKPDRVCQSKALYYFVRDEIQYVFDAKFHDQLENPLVTLKTGGADCEDMSVLLGVLQKAIGNEVRLVFIPGHVYLQVKIPDYKNRWLNMEVTCDTCSFNEVPTDNLIQKKRYILL